MIITIDLERFEEAYKEALEIGCHHRAAMERAMEQARVNEININNSAKIVWMPMSQELVKYFNDLVLNGVISDPSKA